MEQRKEPLSSLHKQRVRARIIMAHAETEDQGSNVAYKDELVLYDFPKDFNGIAKNEIRLRIGDDKTPIKNLPDLVLDNMNFYNSKPDHPEIGDVWYDEAEKTFYLGNSVYEKVEIPKENYKPNTYYKWSRDEQEYVLDTSDEWVEGRSYYVLNNNPIKLSHIIENIEDGLGEGSIQTINESNAIGNYSSALGYDTQAGSKGFKVIDKNATNKTYTLETENISNIAADDKFSIVLTNNYDFCGKIVAIDTEKKLVTVDNFIDDTIKDTSYILLYEKPEAGDYIIGTGAHAEGYQTWAESVGAHAEGYYTKAAGKYSHTEGKDSKAGYASHAEGSGTTAKFSAHAEGGSTTAWGDYSHAEGLSTTANGHSSHAEGQDTISSETASHAEGYSTKANGKYTHAEGVSTIASEMAAHAEGNTTEASGKFSHAEGSATKANGENSHAEGTTTIASGNNSHAEGNGTTASGNAAHTEGQGTIASGDQAHAEGYKSQASYQAAHAEGYVTIATKIGAHAEGSSTEAIGDGAHAEGYDTIASGPYSHAEGSNTTAVSFVTHAEGQGTIARGNAQHVQGKYNIDDTNKKYAHIVGNGTSEQRSNAHTLDWDGNAWFAGKVEATAANMNEGNFNKIIVKNELDGRNADFQANSIKVGDAGIGEGANIYGRTLGMNGKLIIDENNDLNVNSLNINDKNIIDNEGNGSFTSLTIGENNYPVLNFKGIGENLPIEGQQGDIYRIPKGKKTIPASIDYSFQCVSAGYTSVHNYKSINISSDLIGAYYNDKECIGFIKNNSYLYKELLNLLNGPGYAIFKFPFGRVETSLILASDNETILGIDISAEKFYTLASENKEVVVYSPNESKKLQWIDADYQSTVADIDTSTLLGNIIYFISQAYPLDLTSLEDNIGWIDLKTSDGNNSAINFTCSWTDPSYGTYIIDAIGLDSDGIYYIKMNKNSSLDGDFSNNWQYASQPLKFTNNSYTYISDITYYIHNGEEWDKLSGQNFNNNSSNISINIRTLKNVVGYEEFCEYQVTEERDVVDCLKQAIESNISNGTVYLMPGVYTSNKVWEVPIKSNINIIGLGSGVVFDFIIVTSSNIAELTNNILTWNWENITFTKDITICQWHLINNGSLARSGQATNCIFNGEVSICLNGESYLTPSFNNCIFNNNINVEYPYARYAYDDILKYDNCIFNIEKWNRPVIEQLHCTSMENCSLYISSKQKEMILGISSNNFASNNLKNNIYYLKGAETNFIPPHYIEGIKIKQSAFPWNELKVNDKDVRGYYGIDLETCYINNNSKERKEELLIQDIDKDFIQNASSLDKVVIEDVEKKERFPTTIALVSGTENTPDGNKFDRYKLWKENKNFSYLEQITGGFIQGSNHFILGPNFVTGSGHLATGVLHTVEGAGNTIGGVEDGLSDIQLRADHAEGVNNILPSEYGEPQSRLPMARHIEGFGNIGNSVAGSHVQGYYCLKDENNEYIHIVGNGEDDENRSNAHTIDKNGKGWFAGGLTVGEDNRSVLTYNNEGHEQFPYPQINGTMFVLNQDIIEKDNNSVDFTDSKYADRIEEDEHGLWKIVLNKESKLYDILTVAINKIQGVSYEDIPLGMIFNPLNLKLELKNVSDETENPNILDFQDLQYITYYSDEEVALYFDNITTKLSLEYEQETELNPDTGEEEIIRKFYAFNSGVNKKVIVEGFYNYNTNDKYERGLYICTDNGWEKLIIGVNNSSNTNTPIISTLQSGPIILPIPNNATKVDNQYKFTVDLSKYGIKKGQTINVACVGAGGGGAGYNASKTGGSAGKPGVSSSSKNGGQAGTGYGAGGGGCYATGSSYYSTGGGSGYVTMNSVTVEETEVDALVGIGGAGGTGTTTAKREGKPGGSTEFLGIKADGGKGGTYSTSKTSGGMGGNQGAIGVKGNAGGNGGNGWIPSNYDPESKTIQMYGVTSNDNVPTYSGDGAIFIWY